MSPNAPAVAPDVEATPTREDWERNHAVIRTFITKFANENDHLPSYPQIAEGTKLHLRTVKRHMASLKDDRTRFEPFLALLEDVALGMYRAGKKGDSRSAKLFFQYVDNWEERKRVTNVNQAPFQDLTDEELDRRLAAMEKGMPAPAPQEGPNGIPPA